MKLLRAVLASVLAVVGVCAASPARADLYDTPGTYHVNGRDWRTACEPYSATTRCRTEIRATVVAWDGSAFRARNGVWTFNNLTYLPAPRALWGENPLAVTGSWRNAAGSWRTECDTLLTGRGACRTFRQTWVVAAQPDGGHAWKQRWVFNSSVRFSQAQAPAPVRPTIPDTTLRRCILEATGGKLDAASLAKVTYLSCQDRSLTSLEGISALSELDSLNLYGSSVRDLRPLAGTSLTELELSGSPVGDTTGLPPTLTYLGLASTGVTGPAGIGTLPRLQILDLSGTATASLDGISRFAALQSVVAHDTAVSDLTPLRELPALTSLTVSGPRLSNLSPLAGLTGLTHLDVAGAGVGDLTPLAGLSRVQTLRLNGTRPVDLAPVTGLTALRRLHLSGCDLTRVEPLSVMFWLERLYLGDNPRITDADSLQALLDQAVVIDWSGWS